MVVVVTEGGGGGGARSDDSRRDSNVGLFTADDDEDKGFDMPSSLPLINIEL